MLILISPSVDPSCPHRELAQQIHDQFVAFGARNNTRVQLVVGGMDQTDQILGLAKRPHIVVATPGRLAVMAQKGAPDCDLRRIKWLVLDEADRLLDESILPDLEKILAAVAPAERRQTLMFSATMTPAVAKAEGLARSAPFKYAAEGDGTTVKTLTQQYVFIPSQVKDTYLSHILNAHEEASAIVFVAKCETCQLVQLALKELGMASVALNSHMPQAMRFKSLNIFKSGQARILVATDVGSRGLDIPTVELVVNYDIPKTTDYYMHRVGRTARAGRGGKAISIVTQFDIELIQSIEEHIGKKMEEYETDEKEVLQELNTVTTAVRAARLNMHALEDRGLVSGRQKTVKAMKETQEQEAAVAREAKADARERKKKKKKGLGGGDKRPRGADGGGEKGAGKKKKTKTAE